MFPKGNVNTKNTAIDNDTATKTKNIKTVKSKNLEKALQKNTSITSTYNCSKSKVPTKAKLVKTTSKSKHKKGILKLESTNNIKYDCPIIAETASENVLSIDFNPTPFIINKQLSIIEDNSRELTNQVHEKNKVFERISAYLELFRISHNSLSKEQVSAYADFSNKTKISTEEIEVIISTIGKERYIDIAKKELLHKNSDFNLVSFELDNVIALQKEALSKISELLTVGKLLLSQLFPVIVM